MISFYPGPSRVHDRVPRYVQDAHKQGILSVNHRSDTFVGLSRTTVGLLKKKLRIPASYTVLFTGSATECWEIIAQSLIQRASLHLYNGAFGEKWFSYTRKIRPSATGVRYGVEEAPGAGGDADGAEVVCITQNETSNGTQVTNSVLRKLRREAGAALVAVDATSSMGGIALDFKAADIWFASVQKCFGLPAGLGVMVLSPAAVQRALEVAENGHYNSLVFMLEMMAKWQTPFTPNVLGIYLLMRVLEDSPPIAETDALLRERYEEWRDFLEARTSVRHFVRNQRVHSTTVLPVYGEPEILQAVKADARKNGLLLGEGYGEFKALTFRIANFPALQNKEIAKLRKLLSRY